jgi:hypothetical protein
LFKLSTKDWTSLEHWLCNDTHVPDSKPEHSFAIVSPCTSINSQTTNKWRVPYRCPRY